jgi:hypothetical protein
MLTPRRWYVVTPSYIYLFCVIGLHVEGSLIDSH